MKHSVKRLGELLRKYKLPVSIVGIVLLVGLAGLGLWLRNNYLHHPVFIASSEEGQVYTSKLMAMPKNWAVGWHYDCSNVTVNKASFAIIVSDAKGRDSITDGPVAETSKAGTGVTVMPNAGIYKVMVGSTGGCTWTVAAKRSSTVAGYDHETPYPTTAAVAQPKVLLDLSGNGNQQTQPFTAAGNWNIAYTYDCSNLDQAGNFQFDVNNTDGSANTDTGANNLSVAGGTTDYYYDGGGHYLSITSDCNWHVTVKG
jgi:hypothetical protein